MEVWGHHVLDTPEVQVDSFYWSHSSRKAVTSEQLSPCLSTLWYCVLPGVHLFLIILMVCDLDPSPSRAVLTIWDTC